MTIRLYRGGDFYRTEDLPDGSARFGFYLRHRKPLPVHYFSEPFDPTKLVEETMYTEHFAYDGPGRYVSDPRLLPAWLIDQERQEREEKERRARFDEITRRMLEQRRTNALQE